MSGPRRPAPGAKERAGQRSPPIGDYALIGDCHAAALVSCQASIDWCCMPRMDSASVFGRLLDWDRGGYCSVWPRASSVESSRSYVDDTMVLETIFRTGSGEVRLLDCFTVGGASRSYRQLLRVLEGVRGTMVLDVAVCPRFDYADLKPWLRLVRQRQWSAIGGNGALMIEGDVELNPDGHDLRGRASLRAGERVRLSITCYRPEELDADVPAQPDAEELDRRLEESVAWWRTWAATARLEGADGPAARRSALVLKSLTNAPTGAVAAAPTTSLPEAVGGERNWDYRYCWIRDSQFSVRSLAELGCDAEADGLRRFIERTAAGSGDSLQIMYGLGGERRLTELELPLEGYRGSRPVRVGNAASEQLQLDAYGELLNLAWRWHRRGRSPDDDYWRFLLSLVEVAAQRWEEPDRGLWEVRGEPRHFVHSKVMCWAALDRGLRLAEECLRRAPVQRWARTRARIRRSVEADGFDRKRNTFRRAYGSDDVDAALLLLPTVDFVSHDDPRMVGTTGAVRKDLSEGGLLRRYRTHDGLAGEEGVFVACSFWLVECLAAQGRLDEAREVFDAAASAANDLGLFPEEYDQATGELLGNFPQGLSHLSHIAAAVALAKAEKLSG